MLVSTEMISLQVCEKTGGVRLTFAGREASTQERTAYYLDAQKNQVDFSQAASIQQDEYPAGFGPGIRTWYTFADGVKLMTWAFIEKYSARVHFHVEVLEGGKQISKLVWPAAISLHEQTEGSTVLPVMQGILLPNAFPEPVETMFGGKFNNRSATMNWWGELDGGMGVLSIVETWQDALIAYTHAPGEPTYTNCEWIPVMGDMGGLTRKLQLWLLEDCDHVKLCKEFRRHIKENEPYVTLREKVIKNPNVEKMFGTPVLYGPAAKQVISPNSAYYGKAKDAVVPFSEHAELVKKAKTLGLEKGYYHLDGWGRMGYDNQTPDSMPPAEEAGGADGLRALRDTCREQGWLLAYHDQYHDYYWDAPSFDEYQTTIDPTGYVRDCSTWYGGRQSYMCMSLCKNYVHRNYTMMEELDLLPDGVYLDCFGIISGEECVRPGHRMTREQSFRERKSCFHWLRNKGIIVSSEEGARDFMDTLDLLHHSPYFHTVCVANDISCAGEPVPLLNLVYHECIMIPWGLGKDVWGIAQGESGWLHCLLNGGLPYGYLTTLDEETVKKMKIACELQAQVWDKEMIAHRFLSEDMRVQETEFEGGIRVQANFAENTGKILYPDGTMVLVDDRD